MWLQACWRPPASIGRAPAGMPRNTRFSGRIAARFGMPMLTGYARANVSSKLETKTPILADLIKDVRDGAIKVPQFQRPFVWKAAQALELLDSIASNYPVGSLLLWKTSEKLAVERNIGDFRLPETEELSPTDVTDGQQRLTVVYAALGAEPADSGFAASYNLETESFETPDDGTAFSVVSFPLRWIFRTTELLNFRTALRITSPKRLNSRIDSITSSTSSRIIEFPSSFSRDLRSRKYAQSSSALTILRRNCRFLI